MRRCLALSLLLALAACAPTSHVLSGPDGERVLAPCGAAPNCAVSLADPGPGGDAVAPLRAGPDAATARTNLLAELRAMPRRSVVEEDGPYVHAVCTTQLMRYRDDVEFLVRDDGSIDVRSASRIGWYDWEANRERLEALRAALVARQR